jgi:hypothetical protein
MSDTQGAFLSAQGMEHMQAFKRYGMAISLPRRICMKQKLLALSTIIFMIQACNLANPAPPAPSAEPTVIVATNTADTRGVVTLNNVSFTLPIGVANDAQSEIVAATPGTESDPWWGIAPEHLQFKLTGYQLQDKMLEPQILVYPAEEYAQMTNSPATAQIERLKNILGGTGVSKDTLPMVGSFNAGQIFAAHMQLIEFKSGKGVRYLTQYDQYAAPVNNRELVYEFQGLTNDGKYYIIAILPVTSSILAEDEKPESPVPPGGVPLPPSVPDASYYDAVTKALDAMYPDSFNPSLFQLDTLIKSITVTP